MHVHVEGSWNDKEARRKMFRRCFYETSGGKIEELHRIGAGLGGIEVQELNARVAT